MKQPIIKVKLGEWLVVGKKYVRKKEPLYSIPGYRSANRRWELEDLKEATKVLVIGKRTLSNGVATFDSETGYEYSASPGQFMKAFLVVASMRTKPFLVPYFEIPYPEQNEQPT